MLSSRGARAVCLRCATFGLALGVAIGALSGVAAAHSSRTMVVAPSLGLSGVAVRFSGTGVPRNLRFTVLFDVTTRQKVRLCSTTNGASTRWRCTGRIPRGFGTLGPHTVEMDATTASGKGGFEELGTFLVTDLGVLMAAPASTAPGDTVQLRVTASNGNATVARGVRIADLLPAGLRFKRATSPCRVRHDLVTCGPFRMAARSSRVYVITALVSIAHRARLTDSVTIRGSPDPLKRNDAAHVVITVT
jgi:uncharacterized repeat protein (TIGR01451 family)